MEMLAAGALPVYILVTRTRAVPQKIAARAALAYEPVKAAVHRRFANGRLLCTQVVKDLVHRKMAFAVV